MKTIFTLSQRTLFTFCAIFTFLLFFTSTKVQAQYFGQNKMRYKKLDFKVKESPHFDLYYYMKNDSLLNKTIKESEVWYDLHQQVFRDTFERKNPMIIYNNHPDFQQTTAIQGEIGVGTGGVTEGFKNRVVMPIMLINNQTRHVLGHELVHAFQYHTLIEGDSTRLENIGNLPLWMVEGMAEYLSVGKKDAFTAMWMRDAYLNNDIPTLRDLTESNKYFPYRYGQAFWSYIGSTYGDTVIVPLFKATAKFGYQAAIQRVFGYNEATLSRLWKSTIENAYKPLLKDTAQVPVGKLIVDKNNAGNMNVAPAISPDGKLIAFLSEKDLFSIDLFLAEAQTGKIIRKLTSKLTNSHVDEFSFIESAGSFSPDSRKFAFSAFDEGRNKLIIVDVNNGRTLLAEGMGEVGEFSNITWSPDGNSVIFAGLKQGQSDLYQYHFDTKKLDQLTDDAYSETQPAFSNDGKRIVFSYDKISTDNDKGVEINFNLAIMDLSSRSIENLPVFLEANNLNPQFSADDSEVYFLSNRDGFRNLYRYKIATNSTEQLTDYFTGISGITEYSPALSVSQNDDVLYSYYRAQKYSLYLAKGDDFSPIEVENDAINFEAAMLPPFQSRGVDVVYTNLSNFERFSQIDTNQIKPIPYRPKFKLDYLASSGVGVAVGTRYGSGLSSGIQGIFSDILGRNQIFAGLAVNGEIYDFGGQFAYINQARRVNWGAAVSHIPFVSGLMSYSLEESPNFQTGYALSENYDIIRTFQEQVEGFVAFPFSRTKRIEAGAALAHYSYRIDRYSTYYHADENGTLLSYYPFYSDRHKLPLDKAAEAYGTNFKAFTIQQVNAAFVGDNSHFGIAAPLEGYRYRFGVEQYFGDYNFTSYTFDVRKYNRYKPITLAARAYTYMRMGKDENALYPLFLGYPYLIRGYESAGFYNGQNNQGFGSGFNLNQLMGTRIAVANFEVRIPFTGPERLALVPSKMLFSDLNFFFDAGLAWSKGSKIAFKSEPDLIETIPNPDGSYTTVYERVPALSAGVSLRINMFGYFVIEPYYAIPFQRNDVKFGTFGLNFAPGW